jgi:periplasmic divalent cation tolerance protein
MAVSKNIVVFVTAPDEQVAALIGRTLVEERLAACANLVSPIRSIYRWQGAVEDGSEHLMLIKTRASHYPALEARVKQLHPYEVPEIIAVEIGHGSSRYLQWIRESTARTARVPVRNSRPKESRRSPGAH